MDRVYSVDDNAANNINSALELNLRGVIAFSDEALAVCPSDGATVSVRHNLNVKPNTMHWLAFQSGTIWADDADRRLWSSTLIAFHCSKAGRYSVWAGRR